MKQGHFAALFVTATVAMTGLHSGKAEAAVKVQTVDYKQGAVTLEGWLVYDDARQGKRRAS